MCRVCRVVYRVYNKYVEGHTLGIYWVIIHLLDWIEGWKQPTQSVVGCDARIEELGLAQG